MDGWELIKVYGTQTGTILIGIGTLCLGAATLLTAIFLMAKGRSWYEAAQIEIANKSFILHQHEHQRKMIFDLAVEANDLFNRIKIDFDYIRNPGVNELERDTIEAIEGTSDFVRRMKLKHNIEFSAALLRYDERSETIALINRLKPKFRAVFGDVSAFDAVVAVRKDIWVAGHMLLKEIPVNKRDKYENVIWKIDDNDDISLKIRGAIAKIEELCFPIIRGEFDSPKAKIS